MEQIKHWIDSQLSAVKPIAKNGLDIEIKPHKTQRTNEQNRFFYGHHDRYCQIL